MTEIQKLKEAEEYYNLGNTYRTKGDYDRAIEAYKEAIKLDPDDAKAHHVLGVTYHIKEENAHYNYDKAIEAYKEAIKLDPDYVNAHYNLDKLN
jgi:tetratricopeptide (TPR) repeat protein